MDALNPPRRTALDFENAGVVFRVLAGETRCAGPKGRMDLLVAVRAEVEWRRRTMEQQLAFAPRRPAPRMVLATSPVPRVGACVCCADAMRAHRGGDCALCRIAFARAIAGGAS